MSREREMAREAIATEKAHAARANFEARTAAEPPTRTMSIDLRDYPLGLVGCPTVDWVYTECSVALAQLSRMLPPGSEVVTAPQAAGPVPFKRTRLAEQMLANPNWQWICYVDSDMTSPPHAVAQLLYHDLDIVSAHYCQRQPPYSRSVFWRERRYPTPTQMLTPIPEAITGFGCVLSKRRVFEQVASSWFVEDPNNPGCGEGFCLCERTRAAGFAIHLDALLEIDHAGSARATLE